MPVSVSTAGFHIDATGLRLLAKDFRAAGRNLPREIRTSVKDAVRPVLDQAKSNAGWSSRIPASGRLSVTAKGVSVVFGGPKAPDAAPFEHNGQPGSFRHPVYGNQKVWVSQQARPFLAPAWQASSGGVLDKVADVLEQLVLRKGQQ